MTAAAAAAAAAERNNSMITLDVRISCDTFWKYKFDIPIRIRDFYKANELVKCPLFYLQIYQVELNTKTY